MIHVGVGKNDREGLMASYPKLALEHTSRDFNHVPGEVWLIYDEACNVLDTSPSASAALARKSIQYLLTFLGYRQDNLGKQIRAAYPGMAQFPAIPPLQDLADTVRRIGNIAVHPAELNSRLRAFEVEYEDAVWCLEIVELLFDMAYELPLRFEQRATELQCRLDRHSARNI